MSQQQTKSTTIGELPKSREPRSEAERIQSEAAANEAKTSTFTSEMVRSLSIKLSQEDFMTMEGVIMKAKRGGLKLTKQQICETAIKEYLKKRG